MTNRAVVLALLLVIGCGGGGGIDDVDDASALLRDDRAFVTGEEAGRSFARIADATLALGRDCVDDHGRDDARCGRLLAAAAFAQVFAPEALDCTEPGIDEARVGLDRYLAGGDEVPEVPACA